MNPGVLQHVRRWATPVTIGAFLLVAATGLLMFFGIDSGLNRGAHEWLSWALLAGVAAHVSVHAKSFGRHLRSPVGRGAVAFFATILMLSFPSWGVRDSDEVLVSASQALANARISTIASITHTRPEILLARLKAIGIDADPGQTIHQLARAQQDREVEMLAAVLQTPE